MYYTIYKTTNLKTGQFYIGKHQTTDLSDPYLGSGVLLLEDVGLYGRDSFTKEIISVFDNDRAMNLMEQSLVDEALILNPMSYNRALGGEGGPHFKGRRHTAETRRRISASVSKANKLKTPPSDEMKMKISKSMMGNTNGKGKPLSSETKMKISNALKGRRLSESTKAKIRAKMISNLQSGATVARQAHNLEV